MKLRNSKIENFNGFTQWLSCKESTCKAGDTGETGSIPGVGRSLGEGNGDPLQYPCLEKKEKKILRNSYALFISN